MTTILFSRGFSTYPSPTGIIQCVTIWGMNLRACIRAGICDRRKCKSRLLVVVNQLLDDLSHYENSAVRVRHESTGHTS